MCPKKLDHYSLKNTGKTNLNPSDFNLCPAWKYDEYSDLFYPIRGEKDLPELPRDLIIRAVFTAPSGDQFDGYIVSVDRIFSMGLFLDQRIYHVNRNLPALSREQVKDFLSNAGGKSTFSDDSMFPLNFETRWEGDTFVNFFGVFNLP